MNKRLYIILAMLLIVIAVVVLLLLGGRETGILEVSAPKTTPDNRNVSVTVIEENDEDPLTFTLDPGETKRLELGVGRVVVRGSSGNLRSIDVVDVKQDEQTEVVTPLGEQRSIDLMGSQAKFCPIIIGNDLFSYNCQNGQGGIFRHQSPNNQPLFNGSPFSFLKPHKNGLLGFHSTDLSQLQYIDLVAQTVTPVALPPDIQSLFDEEMPVVVTPDESGSSHFALIFVRSNKVYLFEDSVGQTPRELKLDKNLNLTQPRRIASGSFFGDNFLLYLGADQFGYDGPGTPPKNTNQTPASALIEYDTEGNVVGKLDLPSDFFALELQKLSDTYYVAHWADGAEFYHLHNGSFDRIFRTGEISNWAVYQNKAYFEEGGSLFEFVPTKNGLFSLRSLFSSSQLSLSRVYSSPKGIIFTAFVKTLDSRPLNIYRLSDKVAEPGEALPGVTKPGSGMRFANIEDILDFGVTQQQLEALKLAFGKFANETERDVKQVSISNIQAVPRSRFATDAVFKLTFVVRFDGEPWAAELQYFDLTTVRLLLRSEGGVPYDSQNITVQ